MICPKCKATLSDDSRYCVRCGEIFNDEIIKKEKEESQLELLQKAYIGEKRYNLIFDNSISVFYLFLGPFYAFYRKCYNIGIINSVIVIGFSFLGSLVSNALSMGIFATLHLYYSFSFNNEYWILVTKKVNEIIKSNPGKDFVFLQSECHKKGGTNIYSFIILFVLVLYNILK